MSQPLQPFAITAPGFNGLNTQDSSLDLSQGWALVANNCVIDQYGRVGARKGYTHLHTANADITGYAIKAIGEVVTLNGTSYTICAGHNKLFKYASGTLTTLTYGGGGTAPTIGNDNWHMASLNGQLFLFQSGHDPLVFDPAVSTTQYKRVSEMTGYVGTVQAANICISAYGRLWTANTATNKVTLQFSDILSGEDWNTGTSGSLDTTTVWPLGGDIITALGAHNGFLYVFGKNNILIYSGATDPSGMVLADVVSGVGCIARDSIANTGTDIIFLSSTGVRSLQRTIQEKSAPFRELSKNVRNDLLAYVTAESDSTIKAIYSPKEAFYALSLTTSLTTYCFDTKVQLQDGSSRVTMWDQCPSSWLSKQDGTVLLGKTSYLSEYTSYLDNTSTYSFQYYTNHTDFGAPAVTSIPKRLIVTVIGGGTQNLTAKWGYDFMGNFQSQNLALSDSAVAYYGESEYNTTAEYSSGQVLSQLRAYPTGSGKVVQFGFEAYVNGAALSIQKIEIHAKNGKIA